MLKRLNVKNFAIIEDIDITFENGLTVLTGETGAGKSLIIDSIHLLLGERAALEMIRNGEEKAIITGVFTFKNPRLSAILNELDISYEDNIITISRTVSTTKSVIKINNQTVSLNELKLVGKYLADIHEQFDMIKLLNKDNYLDIVDDMRYELIKPYKERYLASLKEVKIKQEEYEALLKQIEDIKQKRETYEYELNELKLMNLDINEEQQLVNRIDLLKNYDKIFSLMQEVKQDIDKDSLSDLYHIKENVAHLAEYQKEYEEISSKLNDYYYEIENIYEEFSHKFHHLDYDPNELDELQTRENELNLLKKKYAKSIPELIAYKDELESLLNSKEDLDIYLTEKKEAFISSYDNAYQLGLDLTKIREQVAQQIEKELMDNLKDLALNSRFKIAFNTANKADDLSLSIFKENGLDEIEFLIETNIGEGLKPLSKVVSGGEVSRIMLAFKSLFIKSQKISTFILDEVDTGISGEIARKVALKIKEISLNTQVIAITHLPQVASLSTTHIKISKHIVNNRTYTEIKILNLEEKIKEIASLISGGKISDKQLEYAKEMVLENN